MNGRASGGQSALLVAAYGGHVDVVEALLAKGAEVDAVDNFGKTPLMGAAEVGHADIVRVLLAAGADVNARAKSGANALTWASDAKVRALLLQAGAKPWPRE